MMLLELADIARSAGVKVVECAGWKERGRPGGMRGVKTIVCHHTATTAPGDHPSLGTIINGRTALVGPLSQYFLSRDGTVYVVAAGRCNHAGVVLRTSFSNEWAVGIEAEAHGVPGAKEDWPEVQMVAYARLCRALQLHYGLSVLDIRGHKEVCSPPGRKSDPDFNMSSFRETVSTTSLDEPAQKPLEEDMSLTDADADRVWNSKNELLLKQSPAGALKTALDRVDADNLQLQVRTGISEALADSQHPLTVRLVELETKLDAILAALSPPKE